MQNNKNRREMREREQQELLNVYRISQEEGPKKTTLKKFMPISKRQKYLNRIATVLVAIALVFTLFIVFRQQIVEFSVNKVFTLVQNGIGEEILKNNEKARKAIIDEYNKKIADIKSDINLTQQEKQKKIKLFKQQREQALDAININKLKDKEVAAEAEMPISEKDEIINLILSKLSASEVSKFIGMASDGITSDEKAQMKEVFYKRFSASEQARIFKAYQKYYLGKK